MFHWKILRNVNIIVQICCFQIGSHMKFKFASPSGNKIRFALFQSKVMLILELTVFHQTELCVLFRKFVHFKFFFNFSNSFSFNKPLIKVKTGIH